MSQPPESPDLMDSAIEALTDRIRERVAPELDMDEVFELFEQLRKTAGAIGVRERTGEIDEFGMDREYIREVAPVLDLLRTRWWRIGVQGADAIPREGPVLFVANRSGMLPWDGLMVADEVARQRDGDRPRFLIADWLITLPWVQPAMARMGGVRACRENAERLLRTGRSVVAFPEGAKGATKVYRERYQVQRFGRGGVVRLAAELGVPLVPVAVVGAEETNPILFKVERAVRPFGLPFVPVTPTFPWLGPLGMLPLPTRWSLSFGDPIDPADFGVDAAADEIAVSRLNEEIRQDIQRRVRMLLEERLNPFA